MHPDLVPARGALAEGRWEAAAEAFASAVRQRPDDVDALEGLGVALFRLEDLDRSFELREQAYRILVERGERSSAARVAMAVAIDGADVRGMAVSSGWLARARTHLDGLELAPEHGWLALWEGHFSRALEDDLVRARERAAEARRIAKSLGLGDLDLLASALEGLISVTEGKVREGMRQLDEATAAAVAGELRDLDAVAATCCFLVHACERVCDWERASQWDAQIQAMAARWSLGSMFAMCQAEHGAMLIFRGEWERAERDLLDALRALEAKRPLVVHEALVQLAELRRRQGRAAEATTLFQRCPSTTEAIIGLAAIALERGEAVRAAESLERLRRRPLAEKWVQRAAALELLSRAYLMLGDGDGASRAAAELRAVSDLVTIDLVRAMSLAAEARLEREDSRARRLLEDAVDLYQRCGAPWEEARARLELAAVLRRLGRGAFADEESAAARSALRTLGVDPVEETPASRPDGSPLTPRELEVLRLVARGLSDKEVAIHLKLSEHTVHRHVANILGKLDLPSRAAAVARASAAGWMADSGHS